MTDVPSNLIPTRVTQLPLAPVADENSLMMIVYQGNNYQIRVGDLLSVAGVPTSTQVIAGTSMTGGGPLTGNVTLSVANGGIGTSQLAASGVTPGTYGTATDIPVFTVDSTGRVMAATSIPATISGYVPTTRQVIAGTGLTGGGALSANVTLNANLSSSTPLAGFQSGSAGSATSISRSDHKHPAVNLALDDEVDGILGLNSGGTAKSLVAAAGAIVWSGADGLYIGPVGLAGQVLVSGGAGAPTWGSALLVVDQPANVVYAGPAAGAAAPTAFRALVNADLPASGVTANTYGSSTAIPVVTVNSKGVITSATTASFTGGLSYQGSWNASTNTPTLTSSVGTNGYYYIVSVAGSTNLNGVTDWQVGDWAIFNGSTWQKIDQTNLVSSVNGQVGVVSIAYADLAGAIPTWNQNTSGTAAGLSATLAVASGGTGQTTSSAAFNALSPVTSTGDLIIGNGTNSATRLAIGTNGYLLTSNGTTASWAPSTGGVTSFSGGSTGLTPNTATTGAISLGGTLAVGYGGTGSTTLTANNVLLGNGTSALQVVAPGASGNVLTSNGTTWASTTPAAAGNYTRTSFTATAGQTTFTATYTVGYVQVFLNGVLLNSTDYTASSGTDIVLATAASLNDIVEVIALYVTFAGGTGTVNSGTSGQLTYYAATGTAVSGTTTGTGVVTALGVNTGSAGAFVVNGGALGTPSSGTLTSATGLPVSTGISGLGTNTATALAVNVGSAGAFVVNGGVLGTPSSGTLTNATGLPLTTGVTGLLPLANGGLAASVSPTTAGNVVFTADGTTWSSAAKVARGTAVATTSGTSIDFTSIPSWVKRITIMFQGVSTNGTNYKIIQIGSGSIQTSGYLSTGSFAGATAGATSYTQGFVMASNSAAEIMSGIMVLTNISGNIWVSSHAMKLSSTYTASGGGDVTLSGTLDRLRLNTVNAGVDSFDAGSINILYE